MNRLLLIALIVGTFCVPATAQDIRIQAALDTGPYYVGLPINLRMKVTGLDENPEPEFSIENENEAIRAGLESASPSSFSRTTIINGQRSSSSSTTWNLVFRISASSPGKYDLGPIVIKQGSITKNVAVDTIEFEEVPTTDDMQIKLLLPPGPFYPEERVPVSIEWWYAGNLRDTAVSINAPIFDRFPFLEVKPASRRQAIIPLDTPKGQLDLPADIREERVDGKKFTVFKATRTMVPDRLGEFEIEPVAATIRLVTEWGLRESGFGLFSTSERYPKKVKVFRNLGQPQKLVIGGFPEKDRPESFVGAVGKGYSINVSPSRTVVRVGDPIDLEITLQSAGNLNRVSLPPLSADDGLSPDLFKLPDGEVAGRVERGKKTFNVSVRVKDEKVTEIPGIAFSWFDTEAQQYRTVRSKPIALNVKPAQMVSAGDVVSSAAAPDSAEVSGDEGADAGSDLAQQNSGAVFTLSGADLAIEKDPAVLLVGQSKLLENSLVQYFVYALGIALLALALVDRRRGEIDPAVVAQRKAIAARRAEIDQADRLPMKEAAKQIAAALSALQAEDPDFRRSETQTLIGELEALSYKPDAEGNRLSDDVLSRSQQLARCFAENAR